VPEHADSWLSTIEEGASRKEAEREYLGRAEWKKLLMRVSVLLRNGWYAATPEFLKCGSPRRDLRAFAAETQRAGARLLFVAAVEQDLRTMERIA
jgi:transcription-repair coupling factor (superfamily II helicase)